MDHTTATSARGTTVQLQLHLAPLANAAENSSTRLLESDSRTTQPDWTEWASRCARAQLGRCRRTSRDASVAHRQSEFCCLPSESQPLVSPDHASTTRQSAWQRPPLFPTGNPVAEVQIGLWLPSPPVPGRSTLCTLFHDRSRPIAALLSRARRAKRSTQLAHAE